MGDSDSEGGTSAGSDDARLVARDAPPGRADPRLLRLARVVVGTAFVVLVVALGLAGGWTAGIDAGHDPWNYLAAGERLDVGHPLYALGPGDRDVPLRPPYWTVPLVGPPLIAVLWRPLAALPADVALRLWLIACIGAGTALYLWMAAHARSLVLLALALLALPMATALWTGNANSLIAVLLAIGWVLWARSSDAGPSAVAGVLGTVIKVTLAFQLVWLLAVGGRRAAAWIAVAVALAVALSLVGAGIGNHVDWLRGLTLGGTFAPLPDSPLGRLLALRAPAGIVSAIAAVGAVVIVVAIVALRQRPGRASRSRCSGRWCCPRQPRSRGPRSCWWRSCPWSFRQPRARCAPRGSQDSGRPATDPSGPTGLSRRPPRGCAPATRPSRPAPGRG